MSEINLSKHLLLSSIVALLCLGCSRQDDLLIRTMVMGTRAFSSPMPYYNFGTYIVFSPDGKTIISGPGTWSAIDELMKAWRVSDGSLESTIGATAGKDHRPPVTAITFDPSGRLVTTGHTDDQIRTWRVSDGALLKTFKSPFPNCGYLSYSPDGKTLVGCPSGIALVFWNTENDSIIRIIEGPFVKARFNSIGTEIITLAGSNREVQILNATDGALLRRFAEIGSDVASLVTSRNDSVLATAHEDGRIKIWRVSDGSLMNTIATDSSISCRIAINTQGSLLAVGYYYWTFREPGDFLKIGSKRRTYAVRLYRTSDLALLHTFEGHRWDVTSVKFSPDGTVLSSCSIDGSIKMWDIKGFKQEGL